MSKLKNAAHAARAVRRALSVHRTGIAPAVRRYLRLYRRRFSPLEIEYYDLLDPHFTDASLDRIMSRESLIALDRRHVLSSYLCLTSDKAVFYAMCASACLPAPALYAVFDKPHGWAASGERPGTPEAWRDVLMRLPGEFVVKPALGLQGFGVSAFRRDGERFVDNDGVVRTAAELYDHMAALGRQNLFAGGYSHHSLRLKEGSAKLVIQRRMRAHPAIADFTGSGSVSTCRVATLLGRDGVPAIVATAMRLVGGRTFTDNFVYGETGNLWASVDGERGTVVEAFGLSADGLRLERRDRHPATGRRIPGFAIPCWADVRDIALRLAHTFRPQGFVNWDIAVTDEGVAVIEGNVGGQMIPTPMVRPIRELLAA